MEGELFRMCESYELDVADLHMYLLDNTLQAH